MVFDPHHCDSSDFQGSPGTHSPGGIRNGAGEAAPAESLDRAMGAMASIVVAEDPFIATTRCLTRLHQTLNCDSGTEDLTSLTTELSTLLTRCKEIEPEKLILLRPDALAIMVDLISVDEPGYALGGTPRLYDLLKCSFSFSPDEIALVMKDSWGKESPYAQAGFLASLESRSQNRPHLSELLASNHTAIWAGEILRTDPLIYGYDFGVAWGLKSLAEGARRRPTVELLREVFSQLGDAIVSAASKGQTVLVPAQEGFDGFSMQIVEETPAYTIVSGSLGRPEFQITDALTLFLTGVSLARDWIAPRTLRRVSSLIADQLTNIAASVTVRNLSYRQISQLNEWGMVDLLASDKDRGVPMQQLILKSVRGIVEDEGIVTSTLIRTAARMTEDRSPLTYGQREQTTARCAGELYREAAQSAWRNGRWGRSIGFILRSLLPHGSLSA